MKDFALPMIVCNMALEIEDILEDKSVLEQTIDTCLHEVFDVFYKPELGCMLENVSSVDGAPLDCFEGREINPGHDLEALWFMMNLGVRRDDKALIENVWKSLLVSLNSDGIRNSEEYTISLMPREFRSRNSNGTRNSGGCISSLR